MEVERVVSRTSPTVGRPRVVDELIVNRLITIAFGENIEPDIKEALCLEMAGIADELAGPSPSLTERQLAESAALDWMAVRTLQRKCLIAAGRWDAAQQASVQTLMDRAHRRYLATIRTLATVRKLARRLSVVAVALTAEGSRAVRHSNVQACLSARDCNDNSPDDDRLDVNRLSLTDAS